MPTCQPMPPRAAARPPAPEPACRAIEVELACFQRRPLLASDACCRELAAILDDVLPRHGLRLAAFAFLPDAARLLLTHRADRRPRLPWVLYVIKRRSERRIRSLMEADGAPLPRALLERAGCGQYVFRFWEPGPPRCVTLRPADLPEAIRAIHESPSARGCCADPRAWRWSSRHHDHDTPAVAEPAGACQTGGLRPDTP